MLSTGYKATVVFANGQSVSRKSYHVETAVAQLQSWVYKQIGLGTKLDIAVISWTIVELDDASVKVGA